jgi:hypothetical protein
MSLAVLHEENIDRRRNPDGNQNYDITKLWFHHNEIIRLAVAGVKSGVEIARLVGCTPQTVSNVLNSDLARARIEELTMLRDAEAIDIGKRIAEALPLAVDVLKRSMVDALDDMNHDTDVTALGIRAASTLMEHGVPKKTQSEVIHGHITLQRIKEITNRVDSALHITHEEEEVAAVQPA